MRCPESDRIDLKVPPSTITTPASFPHGAVAGVSSVRAVVYYTCTVYMQMLADGGKTTEARATLISCQSPNLA
jgi:hypothetical protein